MSRFLKIIVNLILICVLLSAAALLAPSFFGIDTIVVGIDGADTNLPQGSVTYGQEKDVDQVNVGNTIYIKNTDDTAYLYKVMKVDISTGILVLRDAYNSEGELLETALSSACVTFVTVPYLGYLAVATGSVKGWVIIGLGILFLILLLVIAEIWHKDDSEDEDEEEDEEDDEDEEEELSRRERKKLAKQQKKLEKQKKKEQKAAKKAKRKADKDEDDVKPMKKKGKQAVTETVDSPADLFEAAREEIASSVANAMTDEPEAAEEPVDPVAAQTIDLEKRITAELARAAREPEKVMPAAGVAVEEKRNEEPQEEESHEIVIPLYSADELIRKAIVAGDDPEIVEDKDLGLTILDYSNSL